MASILSFLKGLWPWRRRSRPVAPARPVLQLSTPEAAAPTVSEAEAEPPAPAALQPPPIETTPPPALADALEIEEWDEDEPDELDGEEDDDPLAPDPFVHADGAALDEPPPDVLQQRRDEARADALGGEHKVYLSDAAGPGTLAEALNQLLQEGRVTAEFCEAGDMGPHLLYRPKH
ncbi:MAG: hypothetical protein P4L73_06650 [Caulobacteraceae bacterium]|nr:hypothetical protein [Caulobacteraceae bacterium]